jgi:hypothetical protein
MARMQINKPVRIVPSLLRLRKKSDVHGRLRTEPVFEAKMVLSGLPTFNLLVLLGQRDVFSESS